MEVELLGRKYPVQIPWNGKPLASADGFPFLAFDTEFAPDSREIALIQVSNAREVALLKPDLLPALLDAHPGVTWVAHHVACDWPLILDHLPQSHRPAWFAVAEEGRLRDTMILDQLIRLAMDRVPVSGEEDDDAPVPARSLASIAQEMLGTTKDNEDPYRLRFGEIVGKDWSEIEQGFLDYAAKDPILTLLVYLEQRQVAEDIMSTYMGGRKNRDILPGAMDRFGHLSDRIQVEGALALAAIEKNGIGLDARKLEVTYTELRAELDQLEAFFLEQHPDVIPPVYGPRCKVHKPGELRRTENGALSMVNLRGKLTRIAEELKLAEVPMAQGKRGGISASTKAWVDHADKHPFLSAWCKYAGLVKLLAFVQAYRGLDRVHPQYNLLAKTGRTTCRKPNLQQVPKGDFRQHFIPRPGKRLWVGDLSGAELCTFAAFAKQTYGFSVMGEQLTAGKNVHAFFAARILGVPYEDFLALKKTDPEKFAKLRQVAKPANFGLMGGMGPDKFRGYAAAPPYNVHLSEAETLKIIRQWEDTFPEGKLHRSNAPEMRCLARNLGCPLHEVENWLADKQGWYWYVAERVMGGETTNKQGEPYSPWLVSQIRQQLACMARHDDVKTLLTGPPSPAVREKLFRRDVAILTGRITGNVRYNQLRNYPFQGLAADIKRALWRLYRDGHTLVGFVHDELLLECEDEAEGKQIARVVEQTMTELCGGTVPFVVEWHLCDYWKKP